ncbi:hypothetical protein A2U01_0004367 [Trifolium medium]|uniref:Uncharacterized protein n=1 Tax=Trifolium medium TaxID=97028 RepID=A0A392M7T6_9FABA|nr:hypothetical protein [Trifolium medium]
MAIERNMMSAMPEKKSPINEDIVNPSNAGCPPNIGFPESLFPPGKLLVVAKERPTISVATIEPDSAVCFNRSMLLCRRPSCSALNISLGVFRSMLSLCLNVGGAIPWMYYMYQSSQCQNIKHINASIIKRDKFITMCE